MENQSTSTYLTLGTPKAQWELQPHHLSPGCHLMLHPKPDRLAHTRPAPPAAQHPLSPRPALCTQDPICLLSYCPPFFQVSVQGAHPLQSLLALLPLSSPRNLLAVSKTCWVSSCLSLCAHCSLLRSILCLTLGTPGALHSLGLS